MVEGPRLSQQLSRLRAGSHGHVQLLRVVQHDPVLIVQLVRLRRALGRRNDADLWLPKGRRLHRVGLSPRPGQQKGHNRDRCRRRGPKAAFQVVYPAALEPAVVPAAPDSLVGLRDLGVAVVYFMRFIHAPVPPPSFILLRSIHGYNAIIMVLLRYYYIEQIKKQAQFDIRLGFPGKRAGRTIEQFVNF